LVAGIFEFLLSLLGQLVMQAIGEIIVGVVSETYKHRRKGAAPVRTPLSDAFASSAWGVIIGIASALVFRHQLFPERLPGLSLILAPLALGSLANFIGAELERAGKGHIPLLTFKGAASFGFGFSVARFVFLRIPRWLAGSGA
jgi:hypothetical protein